MEFQQYFKSDPGLILAMISFHEDCGLLITCKVARADFNA